MEIISIIKDVRIIASWSQASKFEIHNDDPVLMKELNV